MIMFIGVSSRGYAVSIFIFIFLGEVDMISYFLYLIMNGWPDLLGWKGEENGLLLSSQLLTGRATFRTRLTAWPVIT